MLTGYGDRTRSNEQLRNLNLAWQRVKPTGSLRVKLSKDSTCIFDWVLIEAGSAHGLPERNTVRPGENESSVAVGVTKRAGNPPRFLRQKRRDSPAFSIATLFVDLKNPLFSTII